MRFNIPRAPHWADGASSAGGPERVFAALGGELGFQAHPRPHAPAGRGHVPGGEAAPATVEQLFEQALEQVEAAPQPPLPLTQDHPLIRTAAEYGDLFSSAVRHAACNSQRIETSDDVVTAVRARGACATRASSGATSAPTASHPPTGDPTT